MKQSCLFCNQSVFKKATMVPTSFNNKIFTYKKCKNCGLVFIEPLLNQMDYEQLYSVNYHDEFYFVDKDYGKKVSLINNFCDKNKILDYGCGDGGFLRQIASLEFECVGLDYGEELISRLNEKYQEISFYTINYFWENVNEKFDIIHLGDVLEHLTNPQEIMNKLKQKLNPGGFFVLEGPLEDNVNLAFFFRLFYTKIKFLLKPNLVASHKPYHVLFADYKNQIKFFESLGIETQYYKVSERAWPFNGKLKNIKGPGSLLQYLISSVSIFISFFVPHWGNRFMYIGKI